MPELASYPLDRVPEYLAARYGQQFSVSAVRRWAQSGLRGIRLQVTRIGGRVNVTAMALDEFFAAVSATRAETSQPQDLR